MIFYAKQQHKGVVLISVLCLLMVMTLLTLAGFEHSRLQLQMAQSVIQYHEIQTQLLFQLNKVEQKLQLNDELCNINHSLMNAYPQESTAWWLAHGCLIADKPFQTLYLNEIINPDVCEQDNTGKMRGLIIHRVTMMVLNHHGQTFLQTTIVTPTKYQSRCKRFISLKHYGQQGLLWG